MASGIPQKCTCSSKSCDGELDGELVDMDSSLQAAASIKSFGTIAAS